MRLGTPTPDGFLSELGQKCGQIQQSYLSAASVITAPSTIRVMLGDSSITEQSTFDPAQVAAMYRGITGQLSGWQAREVTTTNNEDIRRVFTKFEAQEGAYVISGHMSIQFHVLLYYKPDYRVIECQKELGQLIDRTKGSEAEAAQAGDHLIMKRLQESGVQDMDPQRLFESLYNDDQMRTDLQDAIGKAGGPDLDAAAARKKELFAELDSSLIEAYQTSQVLIDDARLVTGEEGLLMTVDIELARPDGVREGLFDAEEMPQSAKDAVSARIDQLYKAVLAAAP